MGKLYTKINGNWILNLEGSQLNPPQPIEDDPNLIYYNINNKYPITFFPDLLTETVYINGIREGGGVHYNNEIHWWVKQTTVVAHFSFNMVTKTFTRHPNPPWTVGTGSPRIRFGMGANNIVYISTSNLATNTTFQRWTYNFLTSTYTSLTSVTSTYNGDSYSVIMPNGREFISMPSATNAQSFDFVTSTNFSGSQPYSYYNYVGFLEDDSSVISNKRGVVFNSGSNTQGWCLYNPTSSLTNLTALSYTWLTAKAKTGIYYGGLIVNDYSRFKSILINTGSTGSYPGMLMSTLGNQNIQPKTFSYLSNDKSKPPITTIGNRDSLRTGFFYNDDYFYYFDIINNELVELKLNIKY